jgi:hypothetical protein
MRDLERTAARPGPESPDATPTVDVTTAHGFVGFFAALLIATVTAPVGISGAVFLLPVQLSILRVPNPSVTPTNLLFNVVAAPGALARYRQRQQLAGPLTRQLIAGTLPGVIAGSAIHVYFASGPRSFRVLAALVLLPIGAWLLLRDPYATAHRGNAFNPRAITGLALVTGTLGGIYGVGGGSILGPILVGSGMSVASVAPAALASTFATSCVGVATYALLSLTRGADIAPDWPLGLICGAGGLIGGYLGARLQPRLPETGLRRLLGALAVALAITYLSQAIGQLP